MLEEADAPVALEDILCTEELALRPSRPPEYEKENRALIALIQGMVNAPSEILQTLADCIRETLGCGSAGISLLTNDGGTRFYWPAVSGEWKPHIGGGTPRDFGPCGDVLDLNRPLLFKNFERRYAYFLPVQPAITEALLVPFYVGGTAVGTVWAILHDDHRKFDREDKRQLETLAQFASAAYQAGMSLDASKQMAAIVSSSDDAIISKSLDGVIRSWNQGAERLFGYSAEEAIGKHITLIIPTDRRAEEATILARLRNGERIDHFETIRQRKNGTLVNISLTVSPIRDDRGRVIGASKVARDITVGKEADEARRNAEVSAKLLQAQDAEKRRIARELHDGVGQLMAAIGMNVSQVLREKDRLTPATAQCVVENRSLVDQAVAEIRTVSYLLHPPMLEEMGLTSALPMYIDGFAKRSKVQVTFDAPPDLGRLSPECELTLFRVVQECLTNIHRHSGSSTASVTLSCNGEEVKLEVQDSGKGIDEKTTKNINDGAGTGVGLRGMRERVNSMHGQMVVHSDSSGTSVVVTLPMARTVDHRSAAAT
jgi:PAS domain S-box-containing protein